MKDEKLILEEEEEEDLQVPLSHHQTCSSLSEDFQELNTRLCLLSAEESLLRNRRPPYNKDFFFSTAT